MTNPLLASFRKAKFKITFAWREKAKKKEDWEDEDEVEEVEKKRWIRVRTPSEEGPNGERVVAHIWIPIADVVARWEAEYRTQHGRAPQWEEVARKEYRGCPMEKA